MLLEVILYIIIDISQVLHIKYMSSLKMDSDIHDTNVCDVFISPN
jgi:hypothetical protein